MRALGPCTRQQLQQPHNHHHQQQQQQQRHLVRVHGAAALTQSARLARPRAMPGRTTPLAAAATEAATALNNAPSPAALATLFGKGTEQATEVEASITGQLPAWLSGSLLVNGGGDFSRMRHMFDGYAMVARVRVQDGRAWGAQRFLDTRAYDSYRQQGRVVYREFATPTETASRWEDLQVLGKQLWALATKSPIFTDNASVSLAAAGAGALQGGSSGRVVLAMSETPVASYLVDPDSLSTLQQVKYADDVPGELTTAHPSVLSDGSLVNFTRSLPGGGFHVFKQDPATLKRTEVAFVPDRRPMSPAWVHDFAATDKYAVIIEHPLYMSLSSLLFDTPATHTFMNWKPEDEVLVHLVSLDGSKTVRSFTCPTFFYFHFGNAYESEDGHELYVDVAGYDDPEILRDLSLERLRQPAVGPDGGLQRQVARSSYRRLTVPLTGPVGGRLQAPAELIPDRQAHGEFCEFPSINPGFRGQPYRYVYCLSAQRPTNQGNALAKLDLQSGTAQIWHAPGGSIGEPVFVARPGSTSEADGVVLAPGVDAEGRGLMLVMDAGSWTELARVTLPFGVPNRFHGMWLPS